MDRFYFFDSQIQANFDRAVTHDIAGDLELLFDGEPDRVFADMNPPGSAEVGIVRRLFASFRQFMAMTKRYLPWRI